MSLRTNSWLVERARPVVRAMRRTAIQPLRLRHILQQAPNEFIFINATKRSGSTLLSNILCGHRQICGFGETQTMYRSSAALSELVAKVYWGDLRFRVRERYVLEKVVLNGVIPNPQALNNAAIAWIYLLRDPAAVVRSHMEYHGKGEALALDYLRRRLRRLHEDARYYALHGHRALFLTYEQLIEKPQSTLDAVSHFLDLTEGLQPNYARPRVHHPGAGDQSARIKAGRIIAQPRPYRVNPSFDALAQVRALYAETSEALRRYCQPSSFATESLADK